jgi:O-antigen/teichoic acid export membrane protein
MSSNANKVLVFSVAQVINLVINFFVSPYLARALPKEDYSAYNQTIVIVNLFSVIFSVGLQAVVFYFLSKRDDKHLNTISTLQFLILLMSSLSLFGMLTFAFVTPSIFSEKVAANLLACLPAVAFTFIYNYLISVLIYYNRTRQVAIISVVSSLFSVLFIYISLTQWRSIPLALLFSQVLTPLLGIFLTYTIGRNHLHHSIKPDRQSLKVILKNSTPLYITNLLGSSYVYVSSFFVILILGDVAYANYRNGAIEIPFISTIAFSVSSVLLPELNNYFQSKKLDEAFMLKRKIINQCIFILYPVIIFFIVFHNEFIVAYFSDKYVESAVVFAFYSLTCFVRINDYQDVLITAGKSNYILKANILYFSLNMVLVIVLGYLFGIYGVAAAASLSVFLLAFMLLKKDAIIFNTGIMNFFETRKILSLMILAFFTSFTIRYFFISYFNMANAAIFIVGAVLYFPIVYFYILRKKMILPSITNIVVKKVPLLSKIISVN